jgi:RHH-type proline utilization regulon transcriptional repressor/proline dehydrogenase/delta 1-pyrroline-5-carboxylate dehydrogenase
MEKTIERTTTELTTQSTMERAIALAAKWQRHANSNITEYEQSFHVKMQKMLNSPIDKVFLIELMDQSFRSHDVSRVKDQIQYLFTKYGMATFFTDSERFLVFMFRHFGSFFPKISIPLFVGNIRNDTKSVVLPGDDRELAKHLRLREKQNLRTNINIIGEVVLGEKEAEERIEKYLAALENPNINYISIKISTIYSQINTLAHSETVEQLVHRLVKIFKHAKEHPYKNLKGEMEPKFVNLDMEEYKDLALTVESFKAALEHPDLKGFMAGIVLQAYLPDSHLWQKDLTEWARKRVEGGGSPIKIRIVKGANMEMEETESALRGWPVAPYTEKIDTDSNYKTILEYALLPENARVVSVGAGSHNLFELAYACELAEENGVLEFFNIEMLEGMAEASRMAIQQVSGQKIVVYAPTAGRDQFINAIAYLVRRLDENTNDDNFMRHSFGLKVNSEKWEMLKKQFVESFANKPDLFIGRRRTQDRLNEDWSEYQEGSYYTGEFTSEADTDFILEPNQKWAEGIRERWMKNSSESVEAAPVVVGGEELKGDRGTVDCIDKSQLEENVVCGVYTRATAEDLKRAVQVAVEDPDGWRKLKSRKRQKILCEVANKIRQRRGDLIGVAAAEVGKVFTETDVEVSEAIDFLEFYGHSAVQWNKYKGISFKGKGVGVVVPPWNFPIAIPLGGVAAALAARNTVILKPASNAVLCSYEFCKCFWEAGVSRNTLQFVPCPGSLAGEHLVKSPDVDFVILTGGEDTAAKMLEARPNLLLTAETGGKDATIVTAMADRDQAIRNVVQSAFLNSGQKCSATSLLVLENEVYYDQKFQEALVDAARSLLVGSVWNFKNKIGTLAQPVSGALARALEVLEEGESWVLMPEYVNGNQYMLKPAIKWGVEEGSFCHMTELFGPVLSVMRADDLQHAVEIVNQTGYGLTSGIESLDEREIAYWKENIKAGNLYVNRGTTGAIVLRQPFGGMGKSAIGAGRKVGCYNYITQFMNIAESRTPYLSESQVGPLSKVVNSWCADGSKFSEFLTDAKKLRAAYRSYLSSIETEFSREHDYFKLRGEDNIFRYIKVEGVAIRVSEEDGLFEVMSRVLAAKAAEVRVILSVPEDLNNALTRFLFTYAPRVLDEQDEVRREHEEEFVKCFEQVEKVIFSAGERVSDFVYREAATAGKFIVREKPLMEGRLELLHYFKEQAVSHSYHRYGNLGQRALKKKALI